MTSYTLVFQRNFPVIFIRVKGSSVRCQVMYKCDWRHWDRDKKCNPILTNINFEHKNMREEPFPGSQMAKSGNLTVQRVLYQEAVRVLECLIWGVMPCSLVELYQCFRGMYSLSLSSCQKVLFLATFLFLKKKKKFYTSLCCEWEAFLLTWRCCYFKHWLK